MSDPSSIYKKVAAAAAFSIAAHSSTKYNDSPDCELTSESCGMFPYDSCCVPDMGVFALAIQWIPQVAPTNVWTVHGLWPMHCDHSRGPIGGCGGSAINIDDATKRDPDLRTNMEAYWINTFGNNVRFWGDEWEKHGTCLSTVKKNCLTDYVKGDEALAYFRVTMDLYAKFNVYKMLADQSIFPGFIYSKESILAALQKPHKVRLNCVGDKLREVHFYFMGQNNHRFRQIDGDDSTRCPDRILYPNKKSYEPAQPKPKNKGKAPKDGVCNTTQNPMGTSDCN